MKLYGYTNDGPESEIVEPSELAEITLVADPKELRMIAAFLETAATNMERMGKTYSHEHLADKNKYFQDSPHFVVAKEN